MGRNPKPLLKVAESTYKSQSEIGSLYTPNTDIDNFLQNNITILESLNISYHNINRLKANKSRFDLFMNFVEKKKIDIIEIGETNIIENEGSLLIKKYKKYQSFWTIVDKHKQKCSGVEIIIEKR